MEPKVILYIIIGIIYFVYSIYKKAQENKQASLPKDQSGQLPSSPPTSKPVSAPAANPLEDIMREIRRKQAEDEGRRKLTTAQPKPITVQKKKPFKQSVQVPPKSTTDEGSTNYERVYERELTEEEKIHSGNIRLKNEGTYKVQTIEELQIESDANRDYAFEFDMKQAIIGSIILERKY
jgi:hypothetical protein